MEWIPCEDRLPKNDDWKIITILDEHGDTPYRYSDFGWYFDKAKCWIVDAEPRTDVLAWMSLPLPYNADRKTEPTISKMEQVDKDINVRSKDEPQTEPLQTCSVNGRPYTDCCNCEYFKCTADEPQTDNGIGCSRCEGRFDCYDRDMPYAVRCNNYGKITDEPQTERSE